MLYLMVLGAMFFVAGLPWRLVGGLGAIAGAAGVFAFFAFSHVRNRLMGESDGFQSLQSIQSIQHGGLLGSGDDSFVKQSLPDAHTDYVFSAISEDLGAIVACVLICFLLYMIVRLFRNATTARDQFVFYAVFGTATLFGLQVCINLQAALGFITKGMTLPFISYGGSSFVAFCLLFGMILALIREDKWK
jgi:cell division protein FtsW